MVIQVYVEGGVINGNVDATTASNSEALREELNRFMQKALGREDVTIVVKKCAGYKNAVKEFINSDDIQSTYLYVDLDRVPELREDWFNSLVEDDISIPEDRKSRICFWIQEMEAWFLKQPQAIEDWASDEGYLRFTGQEAHVADHHSIAGKDIEHLQHKAFDVLTTILRQKFMLEPRNGKRQKLRYGKLRHAPGIIAHLSPAALIEKDNELRCFCEKVKDQAEAI